MAEPTLLGLPRELRLQIYQEVLQEDIHYNVRGRWRSSIGAIFKKGVNSPPPDGPIHLPWLALLLTCKTVSSELKSEIEHGSPSQRTYVLRLDLQRLTTVWERIPCAPRHVEKLVAHVYIPEHSRFWGDGGPSMPPGFLFQTLNAFLHAGPHMKPQCELPQPLRLKELEINVTDDRTETLSHMCRVNALAKMLSQYLPGFVDLVKVNGERPPHKPWMRKFEIPPTGLIIDHSEASVMPEHWRPYGYQWGFSNKAAWPKDTV